MSFNPQNENILTPQGVDALIGAGAISAWDEATQYTPGQVVSHLGKVYVTQISPRIGIAPPNNVIEWVTYVGSLETLFAKSLDVITAGSLTLGGTTANAVNIASAGVPVSILGALATAGIAAPAGSALTFTSNLVAGSTDTDFVLASGVTRTAGDLLKVENLAAAMLTLDFNGNLTVSGLIANSLAAPAAGNLTFTSNFTDVNAGTDFDFNTTTVRAAGLLFRVQNHSVAQLTLDTSGNLVATGTLSSGSVINATGMTALTGTGLSFSSHLVAGATGTDFAYTSNVARTAGLLFSVSNNFSARMTCDFNGNLVMLGSVTATGMVAPATAGLLMTTNLAAGDAGADFIVNSSVTRTAGTVLDVHNNGAHLFHISYQGRASAAGCHTSGQTTAAPANAAHVATDANLTNSVIVSPAGASCTIDNPTNSSTGQFLTYTIKNASGGATVTAWGTAFKMAAWVDAANGAKASITFCFDGTNWNEVSRSAVTIPN